MLYQVVTSKLALYYRSSLAQPLVCVSAPQHGIYCPSPTRSTLEESNAASINLLLLSASDGRETLVNLTKSLAEMSQSGTLPLDDINVELIDAKINAIISQPLQSVPDLADIDQGSSHFNGRSAGPLLSSVKPEPDFLLIAGPYIKLDGYPPWQIRLTEIFCTGEKRSSITGRDKAVTYRIFLRGLHQYAGAEMRFGR